jgi:hypothetical protein
MRFASIESTTSWPPHKLFDTAGRSCDSNIEERIALIGHVLSSARHRGQLSLHQEQDLIYDIAEFRKHLPLFS